MSRQSEAERQEILDLAGSSHIADRAKAREKIAALQAQVEQLEQRVDDLSVAEQGEIEASRKAARAYAQVEQGTRKLADVVDKAKALDAENEELTKREAALQKALDEDTKLFQGRWEASEKREAALREAVQHVVNDSPGTPESVKGFLSRALSEQSESDEWSKGEHLAEARAVEEHQERKHRESDG